MNNREALDYIGHGFGDYLGDTPFNDRDLDEALSVLRYAVDRPEMRVTREQVADIVDTIIGVYGAGKGAEALISWLHSIGVEVEDAGEEDT